MNSVSQERRVWRRWVYLIIVGFVVLAPLVAGWAFVHAARGVPQEDWLLRALSSPLSVTCGLILWASVAGIVVLGSVMWHAGAAGRAKRRGSGEAGTVILEFTICLPFMLMLTLLLVQASMLMGGNICVHNAAFLAARAAIVQVPSYRGENEPWNVLETPTRSGKYVEITAAGVWGVMPVSYGGTDIDEEDTQVLSSALANFITFYGGHRPGWVDGYLGRKLYYALVNTSVYVLPPTDGLMYGKQEDITVKLSHKFYMAVPFVAKLFRALGDDDVRDLNAPSGEYAMMIRATSTLTNEGVQSYVEEEMNEDPS